MSPLFSLVLLAACTPEDEADPTETGTTTTTTTTPSPTPPELVSFTASTDGGQGPLEVTYTWEVTRPDGTVADCELDLDSDGVFDEKIEKCDDDTTRTFVFDAPGVYTSTLSLVGGGSLTVTVTVCEDPETLSGLIVEDTTWVDVHEPVDCIDWILPAGASVGGGTLLTVQPGVVIAAEAGAALDIGGGIDATGTADDPIVFRGLTETRGSWEGLRLETDVPSTLSHVTISDGTIGLDDYLSQADITVEDSTFTGNLDAGVWISSDVMELVGITATDNGVPVLATTHTADQIDGASTLTGNDDDRVHVSNSSPWLPEDATWAALDVPYLLLDDAVWPDVLAVDVAWTLEQGVEMEVMPGVGIEVESGGQLLALGSAPLPVEIRGSDPTPGSWQGINLQSVGNELFATTLAHGGSAARNLEGVPGTLEVDRDADVELTLVEVRDGGAYGLVLASNARLEQLSFFTSTDNALAPVWTRMDGVSELTGDDNTYVGNGDDRVEVYAGLSAQRDLDFDALDVPWHILQNPSGFLTFGSGHTLTVLEGAVLEFDADMGIQMLRDSELLLLGTATDPIEMRPAGTAPQWRGIFTDGADGSLVHTHFDRGYGQNGFVEVEATLSLQNDAPLNDVFSDIFLGDGLTQSGAPYGIAFAFPSGMEVDGPGCATLGAVDRVGTDITGQCEDY